MVSRIQHLTKYSPSPSTILYTVSDAPVRATRLSQLTYKLLLLIRFALAGFCVLALCLWGQEFGDCIINKNREMSSTSPSASSLSKISRFSSIGRSYFVPVRACTTDSCKIPGNLRWLEGFLGSCITAVVSGKLSRGWIDWGPALGFTLLLYWLSRRDHQEEQLLVIRGLGIQTSSSSSSYLSSPTTRFIPTSQIQDIFIHEAFIGFEVRFYLAVIVEREEEAVVVFPKMLPKREILEEIWRGSKNVLYRGKKG